MVYSSLHTSDVYEETHRENQLQRDTYNLRNIDIVFLGFEDDTETWLSYAASNGFVRSLRLEKDANEPMPVGTEPVLFLAVCVVSGNLSSTNAGRTFSLTTCVLTKSTAVSEISSTEEGDKISLAMTCGCSEFVTQCKAFGTSPNRRKAFVALTRKLVT